jgi:hypothetical protein
VVGRCQCARLFHEPDLAASFQQSDRWESSAWEAKETVVNQEDGVEEGEVKVPATQVVVPNLDPVRNSHTLHQFKYAKAHRRTPRKTSSTVGPTASLRPTLTSSCAVLLGKTRKSSSQRGWAGRRRLKVSCFTIPLRCAGTGFSTS